MTAKINEELLIRAQEAEWKSVILGINKEHVYDKKQVISEISEFNCAFHHNYLTPLNMNLKKEKNVSTRLNLNVSPKHKEYLSVNIWLVMIVLLILLILILKVYSIRHSA